MGFFSWKTADTQESIANIHSGKEVKPVYLIQPNGDAPIKESAYGGNGTLGGVDVYAWLALKNFGNAKFIDAAISADCGHYYEDEKTVYLCKMHISKREFLLVNPDCNKKVVMFDNYSATLKNGMTPNQCIEQGLWQEKRLALKYPLKFSHNPDAIYEQLPASENCEFQGFFYPA
jgi:hypothetical protein